MSDSTWRNKDVFSPVLIEPPKIEIQSNTRKGMGELHPSLPKWPYFCGIIGPRKSGKSVFLYSLLRRDLKGTYGSAYKKSNITLYSPTKDKDPTLKPLKLTNVYGPPFSPSALVGSIITQQKNMAVNNDQTGVLMVWDDITQVRDAWVPLETLSYYGRHDSIDVLYVAHKMSSIPRGVRTQTMQWFLFRPHEESERQWIMDMFARKRTRDIWEIALLRCWQIPYNFAMIDFEETQDPNMTYRSGLENPLFTPEELVVICGEYEWTAEDTEHLYRK